MDEAPAPAERSRRRLSELDIVYNPSMGAYLIWRATRGFFSETGTGMPVPYAFLVLPIALHAHSKRNAESTKPSSGLTLFAAKLGAQQEDLLAIHDRALALRTLSLSSISAGVMIHLLHLDPSSAQLLSYDSKAQPSPGMVKLGSACEKLGAWFSRLPPEQVASTLRVAF